MVKKKFKEMENRLFNRVFICMKCNSKIKADEKKIKIGKIKCRKCGSKRLRKKHKERISK